MLLHGEGDARVLWWVGATMTELGSGTKFVAFPDVCVVRQPCVSRHGG